MKYAVIFIVLTFLLMDVRFPAKRWNQNDQYEFHDMAALYIPEMEVCRATGKGMNFDIEISFEDLSDEEALGQWRPRENLIRLHRYYLSVDTIAHEVSHMVEDKMIQKGITDEHLEAYMQGYFTQCVYEAAQRHMQIYGLESNKM